MKKSFLAAATMLLVNPVAAFAHHPMGGTTPATLSEGLLSGVGHPIIGVDHLAFVIAVGVAAMFTAHRFAMPLVFVMATLAGTMFHVMAFNLPAIEFVIALSVATLGVMIFSGKKFSALALGAVFAVAGMFHGFAYGEAIFGAETTPLLAYLTGFGVTQYLVSIAAGWVIYMGLGKGLELAQNVPSRIAGGMVAGAGALLLSEHVLTFVGLA